MKQLNTIIPLLLLFCSVATAQNIVVEGVVRRSEDQEVLPYANVFFKNSHRGTISNENGEFKIIIAEEFRGDSLLVSFIGYNTQAYYIERNRTVLEVSLNRAPTTLHEIVISGITARSIIEKAIENIPNNYFVNPHIFRGFYRVTSQNKGEYIHLSEAVFDIYQSSLRKPRQQFKLIRMRAIKDKKTLESIDLGLRPEGIYAFDIVNNLNGIELMNKSGLKLHTFKIEGTEVIDGKEMYKISFDQNDTKKSGYKGYMLIEKESLAFVYFEFGFSPKGLDYYKFGDAAQRAFMKLIGMNIDMTVNKYQITYNKIGDRYHISNVVNDAVLRIKSNLEHYDFIADTRVDYLVTQVNVENASPFEKRDILGPGKFIQARDDNYDTEFWNDYTIVLPTSNFSEIARILESKNNAE